MKLKTKYGVIVAILGILLLGRVASLGASHHTAVEGAQTEAPSTIPTPIPTDTPIPPPTLTPTQIPTLTITLAPTIIKTTIQSPTDTQNQTGLSNNTYYTNTAGNEVHSPANSTDGSVPAGATAQCADGSYSFSQSHSGTCSH